MHNDPISGAIYGQIKRGIQVCIDNGVYGSAVILIYSGIDAMAYLVMPANQVKVVRKDFIAWCDRYISFSGKEKISGKELYSARCGMVHTFGVESDGTRDGSCRRIVYHIGGADIYANASIDATVVCVSIEALADAFYRGIDRFLVDLFADQDRRAIAEPRLQQLVQCMPGPGSDSFTQP